MKEKIKVSRKEKRMRAVMENQKLNLKLMKVNMTIADIMVKKWTTKQDFFAR
jgi:hypothetical protein